MCRASFQSIYRKHFRYVMRLAQVKGRLPLVEAKDAAQEVFAAYHLAIERGRVDPAASPRSLLRTITYRVARDRRVVLRHQGRPAPILESKLEPMDESPRDTERRVVLLEQWRLVFKLLEELDPDRRAVFERHLIEELTFEEIAKELGIPVPTVQSRYRAARADFHAAHQRRRATERRTMRDPALLLPLGAPALLRLFQEFPPPEVLADAEAEVWAGLEHSIGGYAPANPAISAGAPAPFAPSTPGKLMITRGGLAAATGIPFLAGIAAGAIALHALRHDPLPRMRAPEPILAVAPAEEDYDAPFTRPTFLVPAPLVPTPTTPTATVPPSTTPPTLDAAEAEWQCLEAARVKLALPTPDPLAALLLLERCEQRSTRRVFPEAHHQIRRQVRAALSKSGQNL